ncbi:MAG: sulfurtransferase TusA family protein [Gammaproteobacteria bacterium]|nr:sulfurtransferase TusA family protein [Gammaproteobacteria bacterium]
MPDFQQELDARNESCPEPVMKTKEALKKMLAGEVLHVIATDPASVEDITILLAALDDEIIETSESAGEFHFYIKKS